MILTFVTIPDITGLDLREGDRRWLAILDGHHDIYHGEAVNPRYLSVFERLLGYGKNYRPEEEGAEQVVSYKAVKGVLYEAEMPEVHSLKDKEAAPGKQ